MSEVAGANPMKPRASLAFDVRRLSVWNGSRWVLENLQFSIPRGAFCVVLGSNGAGKSSLLGALSGVLDEPWHVSLDASVSTPPTHRVASESVNWLGQKLVISEDMSVREFLCLPNSMGEGPRLQDDDWSLFGADELLELRISALSGGQWQRVRLARALAMDSKILLLDEPDGALDARWRQVLWTVLRERRAMGATILLALHHYGEVRAEVSHWLGLESGRLVFCESGVECFPQAYVDRLFSEKSLTRCFG